MTIAPMAGGLLGFISGMQAPVPVMRGRKVSADRLMRRPTPLLCETQQQTRFVGFPPKTRRNTVCAWLRVLVIVADLPGVTVPEISDHLCLENQTVVHHLSAMQRLGMVSCQDPLKGKALRRYIEPAGAFALAQNRELLT